VETGREQKRRRISIEPDGVRRTSGESPVTKDNKQELQYHPPSPPPSLSKLLRPSSSHSSEFSPKKSIAVPSEITSTSKPKESTPVIIDLDDSIADEAVPVAKVCTYQDALSQIKKAEPVPVLEDSDDDELAAVVARARQKAKRRELQRSQSSTQHLSESPNSDALMPHSGEDDPVINIFIHPRLPNTEPLMVKRKYRQNLKAVREAWCQRNSLTPDIASQVYLTWRGARLFDVASCKSLGIELDLAGHPVLKAAEDGFNEAGDKIVLVATTRQIQEEEKKRKELEKKQEAERAEGIVASQPVVAQKQYKIILRSKGHPDQKLIVKEVSVLVSP
jgi:hypothetical protein